MYSCGLRPVVWLITGAGHEENYCRWYCKALAMPCTLRWHQAGRLPAAGTQITPGESSVHHTKLCWTGAGMGCISTIIMLLSDVCVTVPLQCPRGVLTACAGAQDSAHSCAEGRHQPQALCSGEPAECLSHKTRSTCSGNYIQSAAGLVMLIAGGEKVLRAACRAALLEC